MVIVTFLVPLSDGNFLNEFVIFILTFEIKPTEEK